MNSATFQKSYEILVLVFLGILSVSGTIALRNILHLVLLVALVWYVVRNWRAVHASSVRLVADVPGSLWLWFAFLLLYPLIAPDSSGAWGNLLGNEMWGVSMLTWVLAWGSFLIVGAKRLSIWRLALVSAVPVYIHLFTTVLAWAGVLQPAFYSDPSLNQVWESLRDVIWHPSLVAVTLQSFPMGFRGIEPMHGNFGYPSSLATCLGMAAFFDYLGHGDRRGLIKAATLVSLCFICVVIAQSRAAAYFNIFIIILSCIVYWAHNRANREYAKTKGINIKLMRQITVSAMIVAVLSEVFFLKVITENPAWYSMWDKAYLGFQVDEPRKLLCDGLDENTSEFINRIFPDKSEQYLHMLQEGLKGDGARALLARVGSQLTAEHPWGLNGGRDAFERRMNELCGHVPAMSYAHAHNAWINLTLALGWLGGGLYLVVLLLFAIAGWASLTRDHSAASGIALFLMSIFWILRGFTDAVFQEHYLQMQAFYLLTIYLVMKSGKPRL